MGLPYNSVGDARRTMDAERRVPATPVSVAFPPLLGGGAVGTQVCSATHGQPPPLDELEELLPCFGAPEVAPPAHVPESAADRPPPPPPPIDYDEEGSGDEDDGAVTVTHIPCAPIAGEPAADGACEQLEKAASELTGSSTADNELTDEVSAAAEFLAQFPREEAEAILAAYTTRGGETDGPGAHFAVAAHRGATTATHPAPTGRPGAVTPRGGVDEAVLFLESLLAHLPDTAAASAALRRELRSARKAEGAVSQFLSRRRHHRRFKARKRGNWEEHFDVDGNRYFYNSATQRTQWDVPPEFVESAAIAEGDEAEEDGA